MATMSSDKIYAEFNKLRDEIDEVLWQDRNIKSCYKLSLDLIQYQESADDLTKALNTLETSLTKIMKSLQ